MFTKAKPASLPPAAPASELFSLPDALLLYVRKSKRAHSALSLAKHFQIDIATLKLAIDTIVSWGYDLKRQNDAVQFAEAPDLLSATEIQFGLKTKIMGTQVHAYRSLKSTNDLAADLAEHGAPEGTVVTSEEQTRGRGRLGRTWHSPGGTGIYISFILRPSVAPERAPGISVLTALALADTLVKRFPKGVQIKWPNDVLVSGRKVAGILTELNAERGRINYVIVGVGINANQKRDDFPEELRDRATSLRVACRHAVNRPELLREFLHQFEKEYFVYQKEGLARSHGRLKKYSSLLGQEVTLDSGGHRIHGKAVDITADGGLVLDCSGERRVVSAGEVTVVKK